MRRHRLTVKQRRRLGSNLTQKLHFPPKRTSRRKDREAYSLIQKRPTNLQLLRSRGWYRSTPGNLRTPRETSAQANDPETVVNTVEVDPMNLERDEESSSEGESYPERDEVRIHEDGRIQALQKKTLRRHYGRTQDPSSQLQAGVRNYVKFMTRASVASDGVEEATSLRSPRERQLSTVLWRAGLARTSRMARQSCRHGHVQIRIPVGGVDPRGRPLYSDWFTVKHANYLRPVGSRVKRDPVIWSSRRPTVLHFWSETLRTEYGREDRKKGNEESSEESPRRTSRRRQGGQPRSRTAPYLQVDLRQGVLKVRRAPREGEVSLPRMAKRSLRSLRTSSR